MADISAIKLPNGTTYNLKDTTARNAANSAVPNTRTVNGKALSSNISLGAGDVGAHTKSETDTKINAAVASTYKYKGSVTADKLPTSGQVVGDVYNITNDSSYGKAGMNVAWNGTTWDALGSNVDLSAVSKIINDHIANKSNPHAVTKAQVGLGSVANLDQSKAIKSITRSGTTFTATALDGTTTTFTQQDTNTTYGVATSSADGLMSKSDKAKLDGVAAGADVSPIKTVKVNGTALTPDSNKAVNVTVPTLANNATTTASGMALDARMGKTLSDQISSVKAGAIDQIVNLTAAGWTGDAAPYSQAVNVTGMSSELLCELFSACSKSATVAERKAYNKAYAIVASGYAETADGKVTFYADKKPAIDIGVRIKSISKANAVSDQTSSDISNAVDAMSNTLEERVNALNLSLAKLYPVGSIYLSVNDTDPGTFIGGTWERIKDCFLLAAGDAYSAGSTGGNVEHTHKYGIQYGGYYRNISLEMDENAGVLQGGTGNPTGSVQSGTNIMGHINTNTAQGNKDQTMSYYKSIADTSSASNMPPYLAVYMWKRTA